MATNLSNGIVPIYRKVTKKVSVEQERYHEIRDKHEVPSGGEILFYGNRIQ